MVVAPELLSGLNAEQLRELARDLIAQVASRDQQITSLDQAITSKDREILYRQAKIDQRHAPSKWMASVWVKFLLTKSKNVMVRVFAPKL